ncbi:CG17279, partial [Drosophila busckii]
FIDYILLTAPDIEQCVAGDGICIANVINFIIKQHPQGIPEIGLDALDAINFDNIIVSEAEPDTPLQLSLKFNSLTVHGFENTTILRAKGFEKQYQRGFELVGFTPLLRLDGEYEATGKLLLLPLEGKSQARVQLKDCKFTCRAKAAEDRRVEGKLFLKITKFKCLLIISGLHVNFENLLNNKELSDTMNELINNNWQDVWQALRVGMNSAVDQVAETILTRVLSQLSYDDFYKP